MTNIITISIKVLLPFIWTFIQINLDTELVLAISQLMNISGIDMILDFMDSSNYAEILLNAETRSMVWGLFLVFLSPLCFFFLVFFLNTRNAQGEMVLTNSIEKSSNETMNSKIHTNTNSTEMKKVSLNFPNAPSAKLILSSINLSSTERN